MTPCFSIVCFSHLHLQIGSCSLERLCLDSGHGGQTKDTDGDEADGYDEGM